MKLSIITATYNRPQCFKQTVLPSILNQSDCNFEWVVVNDGANLQTRNIVAGINTNFPITYLEMEHLSSGFGLCYARNLGIQNATGDLVCYLDDDNSIAPEFVASVRQFFQQHPYVRYSMLLQHRRRDIAKSGTNIRQGKPFVSPSVECGIRELILQQEIFDSNGFTHYRQATPAWNPSLKVFADYEYLLQCAGNWGESTFKLNSQVLVSYIQSSEGIIGRSTYEQWAKELAAIAHNCNRYPILQSQDIERLQQLVHVYQNKARFQAPAFV
jgi:hypothetical protein